MKSNFDFLNNDVDTSDLYKRAVDAEQLYASRLYSQELSSIRTIIETVARTILDFNYVEMDNYSSLNDCLRELRNRKLADEKVLKSFYALKDFGNKAAHELEDQTKAAGLEGLKKLNLILVWFANNYTE